MHTLPMQTAELGLDHAGLDDFRISSPREIAVILRQLRDGSVPLNVITCQGKAVSATVWVVDTARGSLGLRIDADDPHTQDLLDRQEAVVVGCMDSVKHQFDIDHLVLVRGESTCVLNCSLPGELFRFQRRNAFRVRPLLRGAPTAHLHHSALAEMQLALRVLDVSIGGCALFLPHDVPPMQPSSVLNRVEIELDADTTLNVNLRLQHVTSLNADSKGVRLGCEFVGPDANTLRTLQLFIDRTQKSSKLVRI